MNIFQALPSPHAASMAKNRLRQKHSCSGGISLPHLWNWVKYIKILTTSYMHQLQELYQVVVELEFSIYPLIFAPTLTYCHELWKVTVKQMQEIEPKHPRVAVSLPLTGWKVNQFHSQVSIPPPRWAGWPGWLPAELLPEQTTAWTNPRST